MIAYLAGMVWLGVRLGRGQQSAAGYLLGNRDLPWPALLVSIVATETSTVTLLSVPGLVYGEGLSAGDMRFLQLPLGYLLGRVVAARLLLPMYFEGRLFTAYEALQLRFGPVLRGVASALFLAARTLADGLRLYLTAVVLQLVLQDALPGVAPAALLAIAVLVIGASTLVYTFFGGVRAVVWTDVLQFAIYMLGALAAAALLLDAVGSQLGAVLSTAEAQRHFVAFDLGLGGAAWPRWLTDAHTLAAGLLGGAVLSLGTHGVDQLIVQRYLCARSQRDAQKALVLSGVVVLLQFAFFLGLGFLLWTFYQAHRPQPPFADADQVFARYLVQQMPPGLRGLLLGAVFAAAMSTLSGSLNSSASALVNDIVLPLQRRSGDDAAAFRLARRATLLFGLLQIGVGVSGLGGEKSVVDQVLAIASFTTGLLLGVFLLARCRRPVPPRAAVLGLVAGAVAVLLCRFAVPPLTADADGKHGFVLAYPWYAVLGSSVTFLVGLLAAKLGKPRQAQAGS